MPSGVVMSHGLMRIQVKLLLKGDMFFCKRNKSSLVVANKYASG